MAGYSDDLDRWMAGGVVDNDREEARSARRYAERCGDMTHPPDCGCGARSCLLERSGMTEAEARGDGGR